MTSATVTSAERRPQALDAVGRSRGRTTPEVSQPVDNEVLRVGDLASRTGVSIDALRYYERRGLLQPTGRRASGYREYAAESVALVRFIKRAQALGFSLAEVDELVHLRGEVGRPGAALAAREVAVAKMQDIDERVRQLQALRTGLAELVNACESSCGVDGSTRSTCPIIGALDDPASP